ncbi:MAG TPA: triose-phosphate isomerase [Thermomicrobiales bacterium]|nr:triose-phosphate isomerase [Thermomicrobiales bacterium]
MSRTPLAVANWKMNTDLETARVLAQAARDILAGNPIDLDIVLCPPFPWLVPVAEALDGSPVGLGAQDCSPERDGAFTGDVSAAMLAPWCGFVIVGHSERRHGHGETDALVRRKLDAVLGEGMRPILCIGELEAERESGQTGTVIEAQVQAALDGLPESAIARVIVAYEPVWAIGTGRTATAADAQEVAARVRSLLAVRAPAHAETISILYGGSVKAENVAALTAGPDVDGVLVGSASLDPAGFAALCRELVAGPG